MIKPLFIVTSAIETRFGIYTPEQRIEMTLTTLDNIRKKIPNVVIAISEVSGNGLSEKYENVLLDNSDYYFDFTSNVTVREIYNKPLWFNNWDVVKNLTELTTFPIAMKTARDNGALGGINRIFKMSGRYLLNDKFDIDFYGKDEVKDKIVIGKRVPSQFPYHVTLLSEQYMARLLSWPSDLHEYMIGVYEDGRDYMIDRVNKGGYADIEHCLFYALNKINVGVLEVDEVGVYGNIAPNGLAVVN